MKIQVIIGETPRSVDHERLNMEGELSETAESIDGVASHNTGISGNHKIPL
jgi:hypothetical protein